MCTFDGGSMLIDATWTAATGLQELLVLKDGLPVLPLPPDATAAEIPVDPGDFGQVVMVLLQGSNEAGVVCASECLVFVPPP